MCGGGGWEELGGGLDMIEPGKADTKLVETARALPGLGRSLYGKEGRWRGGGRGRRRSGAVVRERERERERERDGAGAAARVRSPGSLREAEQI